MRQPPDIAGLEPAGRNAGADDLFAGFSSALFDPELPEPAGVTGPDGKAAQKRFDIYRNNVTVSLTDALADIFPAVQRIVGEEFFRAMARIYIRRSPPKSRLLFEYGSDFAAFVDGFEHSGSMPWLGDVARIERAWLDAYHASDAPVLSPDQLAAVPPEQLAETHFNVHPACRVICSSYPVFSIYSMNRQDGQAKPLETRESEDVLITRAGLEVQVRTLPPGGARFLQSLIDGDTLSEAADMAMRTSETFDFPANIAGMLEAGVFTSIRQDAPV